MRLAATLVFLFPVVAARHHHMTLLETILKPKGNLYSDINIQIQNVANGLFDKLNIGTALHNKTRVKLLLTMHYDLKSVAEKNYDMYENMKVAAEPDNATAISHTAKKLCEIISDLMKDDILNKTEISGVEQMVQTTIETKYTKFRTENMTTPIFRDSKEFDDFVKKFVDKVDKLSLKDFYEGPGLPEDTVAPKPLTFEEEEDIHVWEPPDVLELDYVNDTDARRIYHGKRTRIKTYPFMASVHIMGQFACAGCVISRDLILSAASCLQLLYNNRFYRENPRSVHVRLGSDYYAGGGESIEVVETYFHPSYDPKTLKNNLVILRIQKLLKFMQKQRKVKRILYDTSPSHLPANTNGILILGWGARKHSHVVAPFQRLMVAQLDFYHIDECANIYSRHYVTDHNFCAGFLSTGGGACNKDVGGPGIVGGILVGVVSFGAPVCGTVDAPTVFTKLGFYSRWIESIIDLRPPAIGVKTTVRTRIHKEPSPPARSFGRPKITAFTAEATYRAHEKTERPGLIQDALNQLSKLNNSVLHDILFDKNITTVSTASDNDITSITKYPAVSKLNIFSLLPEVPTTTVKVRITTEYVTEPETADTTKRTPAVITNEEGLIDTKAPQSKPNTKMTVILTLPTLPTIPSESDEYVTVIQEFNKLDPNYYESYEYKYERTHGKPSATQPYNKRKILRQKKIRKGGTTVSYYGQKHQNQNEYEPVTPINKLKVTKDRRDSLKVIRDRWYEVEEEEET